MTTNTDTRILVWDFPTRIFHWLLVASFAAAWLTHEDNRFLDIHVFAGYLFLSLLLFRLAWGVVGSRYARFQTFAHRWPTVWAYTKGLLTGEASRYLGHNPAGGWAIFVMLALGLLISLTGLTVLGGEEGHGPLAGLVSFDLGEGTHELHEVLSSLMLGVIAIHILAVFVESFLHRENLVRPMITGYMKGRGDGEPVAKHGLLGIGIVALSIVAASTYFWGYMIETQDDPYRIFKGPTLPDNALWRQECGDCHLAFHPSLLPARSWVKLLETQSDHFGEDLGLDQTALDELRQFHTTNAAESRLTEPANKIIRSVPAGEAPLAITQTQYWKNKHRDIDETYWKNPRIKSRSNCAACHLDAKAGTFEDAAMRLPDIK
ncbi:MAG: hypothetical protein A2V90_03005 [Gammaproteobacteria bacterium RBG_16_57_12]|nr:MAG: hypothetical protein A2V90_03005 [Gammaproteobacteria bacterium RBG_16_57_12]